MDQNFVANLLSLTLFVVSLFISFRAFYLYIRSRSRRLFILSLSMGMISLTAMAGYAGDNITSISLNVDWFNYIGQTVSYLFILLSFFSESDSYLRSLMRWQIAASALLLILMLLAPVLPPEFPDPAITKSILSGSRGLICFIIFFYYAIAFMDKETRFSLLMSVAFLLLSIGYSIIIPKYTTPNDVLDRSGDLMRIAGLVTLLFAVLLPDVTYRKRQYV
jgi:hypothetical protein